MPASDDEPPGKLPGLIHDVSRHSSTLAACPARRGVGWVQRQWTLADPLLDLPLLRQRTFVSIWPVGTSDSRARATATVLGKERGGEARQRAGQFPGPRGIAGLP
jgi:hypothetical protein